MFGYITIHKPDLKFKEYDVYRGYYCGLCYTLKEMFSQSSRFSLNYDLTFLAILLSSLYDVPTQQQFSHCLVHPIHKHLQYHNDCIDYAAKMTIVLSYLKCLDDWHDEKKMGQKIYGQMLKKHYQRIKEEYPNKIQTIENELKFIQKCENQNDNQIDSLSSHFGRIMGEVFVFREDEWRDELYELGFYLGKYIYIMDAYDDIEKDIKEGNFNPFIEKYNEEDFEEKSYNLLEMMIAKVADIFEYLPIVENAGILRNILYSGVWTKYELRKKQRMGDIG